MNSYDSESRRILQHFSRSTRFTHFCTAQISKFQLKIVHKFCSNEMKISFHSSRNWWNLSFFCEILMFFVGISRRIAEDYKDWRYLMKITRKVHRKCPKFPELMTISFVRGLIICTRIRIVEPGVDVGNFPDVRRERHHRRPGDAPRRNQCLHLLWFK